MTYRWAIVDCVTTGLHVKRDHLIEISVLVVTESGIEATFNSLIKPPHSIPASIVQLTGISNELVRASPTWADIAPRVRSLFVGCIFVAHNARFNYAFIKNNLKSVGESFTASVLCTMKLFKRLYPHKSCYHLSELALAHGLSFQNSHRTQQHVFLIQQLLSIAEKEHGLTQLLCEAKTCYQQSSIPSKLETDLSSLPVSPGVYFFYGGKTHYPLYIGKSVSLRQRILSHFQADYTDAKEFKLAQLVERVEVIPTAGELSALLLESALIKMHNPLFNRKLRRKKLLIGFKLKEDNQRYLRIEMVREEVNDECSALYGCYSSMVSAKQALLQLVKEHQLCAKLCGLEKSKSACFSYQLKRCLGACVQEEACITYNTRVIHALDALKRVVWPFAY